MNNNQKYDYKMLWKHPSYKIDEGLAKTYLETPNFIIEHLKKAVDSKRSLNVIGKQILSSHTLWYLKEYKKIKDLKVENLFFNKGIVKILEAAILLHTHEGEHVMIPNPIYGPFIKIVEKAKRKVAYLKITNKGIDFADMKKQIKSKKIKLILFCHPHNPSGYVFTKQEVHKIYQIAKEQQAFIYSDEAWSDIVYHQDFYSFAQVDQSPKSYSVSVQGLGKGFLLQAIKFGYAYSYNTNLIKRLNQQLAPLNRTINQDPLVVSAIEICYSDLGAIWLAKYEKLISNNYQYVKAKLAKSLINVRKLKATSVLWLDFSKINLAHQKILDKLKKNGIFLANGLDFGSEGLKKFRLDLAIKKQPLEKLVANLLQITEFNLLGNVS